MGRLILLFTLIPALEIYLLLQVGSLLGAGNTFLLIIATGVVGAYYARQQGFEVMLRLQRAQQEGRLPGNELVDGAMLLVGGALLITPGILTDVLGFSLIFPPLRALWKRKVMEVLRRKMDRGDITIHRF